MGKTEESEKVSRTYKLHPDAKQKLEKLAAKYHLSENAYLGVLIVQEHERVFGK